MTSSHGTTALLTHPHRTQFKRFSKQYFNTHNALPGPGFLMYLRLTFIRLTRLFFVFALQTLTLDFEFHFAQIIINMVIINFFFLGDSLAKGILLNVGF